MIRNELPRPVLRMLVSARTAGVIPVGQGTQNSGVSVDGFRPLRLAQEEDRDFTRLELSVEGRIGDRVTRHLDDAAHRVRSSGAPSYSASMRAGAAHVFATNAAKHDPAPSRKRLGGSAANSQPTEAPELAVTLHAGTHLASAQPWSGGHSVTTRDSSHASTTPRKSREHRSPPWQSAASTESSENVPPPVAKPSRSLVHANGAAAATIAAAATTALPAALRSTVIGSPRAPDADRGRPFRDRALRTHSRPSTGSCRPRATRTSNGTSSRTTPPWTSPRAPPPDNATQRRSRAACRGCPPCSGPSGRTDPSTRPHRPAAAASDSRPIPKSTTSSLEGM